MSVKTDQTKKVNCKHCGKELIVGLYASRYVCEDCKVRNKRAPDTKIIKCGVCGKEIEVGKRTAASRCDECKEKGLTIEKGSKILKCSVCGKDVSVSKYTSVVRCEECKTKNLTTGTIKTPCKICGREVEVGKYANFNNTTCDRCQFKGLTIKGDKKEVKCYTCDNMILVGFDMNHSRQCDDCLDKGIEIKTKLMNCYVCGKEIEAPLYSNRYQRCDECIAKGIRSESETKIIPCHICGGDVEVGILLHITTVSCDACKKKGLTIDKYIESCEKRKNTFLEKFGVENAAQLDSVKEIVQEKRYNSFLIRIENLLKELKLELTEKYIGDANTVQKYKCLECNTEFKSSWFDIQQNNIKCPTCYPKVGNSKPQQEIYDYIISLGFEEKDILYNDRKTIFSPKTGLPLELDIYIPSFNLAIEHDGLYYHSEERLQDSDYHIIKTKLCADKNIRLIHIFEDEWQFKQDICKHRLSQILNKSTAQRIHARECEIKVLSSDIKNKFLDKYHIQGPDSSTIKLGAIYDKKILVAVMTFSKGNISKGSAPQEDVWELNRFCSNYNYHIPGIGSKLLEYFKRNYKWKEIFSYADLRWSNGNLYSKIGFDFKSYTKPNYWYVKNSKRIHRFNLRKSIDNPENLPESVIRFQQGYNKVWDCGNLKFILENKDY